MGNPWTFVQGIGRNAGSASSTIAETFSSPNTAGNVLVAGVTWVGSETIVNVLDEEGNAYVQLGPTATQGSGSSQLNSAIFYALAVNVDTVGMTVTATFSDNLATKRFIGIGEFNNTNIGSVLSDPLSIAQFSTASLGTAPTINTYLSSLGELLLACFDYQVSFNVRGSWAVVGQGTGGQALFYQVMTHNSGPNAAEPATISAGNTGGAAVGCCAALFAVNPTISPFWAPAQVASNSVSGPAASIVQQFSNPNTYGNLMAVGICWQGAETIASLTDDQGNTYTLTGPVVSEGSGGSQINSAIYWGWVVNTLNASGVTITAIFSDSNATNLFIAIGEFNDLTATSGSSPLDVPSVNQYSSGTGSTTPTITTTLAVANEVLFVATYLQQNAAANPGWNQVSANSIGQGLFFQVISAAGPYSAQPVTTVAAAQVMACAAFLPLSPAIPPPAAIYPYSPLLAPQDLQLNFSPINSMTLLQALQEISTANPYTLLTDWNGNTYSAATLLANSATNGSISAIVDYSKALSTITWLVGGQRFGTLYVLQSTPPANPGTLIDYYSLGQPAVPCDAQVLVNPKLKGISIRQQWKQIETSQGVYNWSFFDSEVARAVGAGKDILLRVSVQQQSAPGWLYKIAQPFVTAPGPRIWVYWDPAGLAAKWAMYQAMGKRYSSIPNVKIVSNDVASTGAAGWAVPHTSADIKNWNSSAYNYATSLLVSSVTQSLDVMQAAFPSQNVYICCGRNGNLDATPDAACQSILQYAFSTYGKRMRCGKNGWAAFTPVPAQANNTDYQIMTYAPTLPGSAMGGQADWWIYGDPTFVMNKGQPDNPTDVAYKTLQTYLAYANAFEQDELHYEMYQIDTEQLSNYMI